jgi:hypothetical protein
MPLAGDQQGFWAYDLHLATSNLTQNPPPPARSQRIAVLFADWYRPYPDALGVMFDRGFDPGDDPSSHPKFRQSPREGCAIFLRKILQVRPDEVSWEQESLFTTIHEMGHLFNLQHVDLPPNFLARSPATKPFPPVAFNFISHHQLMLAQCSKSPHVWPGGTIFSDTGDFAHLNTAIHGMPPPAFGLELVLSMGQREFWRFEPVELDIEVRVLNGLDRSFRIPDALDPGYDLFDIWIEEPSGERRRFRSPRRYCWGGRTRLVASDRSFRRDISIFGQAGGYTFRVPGIHRLWAEFQVRSGSKLRSNELEVNVKPRTNDEVYRRAQRVLGTSDRAKVLYHRLLRANPRQLEVLRSYCENELSVPSVGSVQYAVARALVEQSMYSGQVTLGPRETDLLRRAIDNRALGDHQRTLATRLLEKAPRAKRRLRDPEWYQKRCLRDACTRGESSLG